VLNNDRGDGKIQKPGRNEWYLMVRGETVISHNLANSTEKTITRKGA